MPRTTRTEYQTPDEQCLFEACEANQIRKVKSLLKNGVSVDARNRRRFTPLMVAVREGHTEIARLLIAQGADLDAQNQFDETPLMLAARTQHYDCLDLLLDSGASIDAERRTGWTALAECLSDGDMEGARRLLVRGADPSRYVIGRIEFEKLVPEHAPSALIPLVVRHRLLNVVGRQELFLVDNNIILCYH